MDVFNRNAAGDVAVREFHLASGPCDYLLFVGGKAAGVIEVKKAGVTLSSVAGQSAKYMHAVLERFPVFRIPIQRRGNLISAIACV